MAGPGPSAAHWTELHRPNTRVAATERPEPISKKQYSKVNLRMIKCAFRSSPVMISPPSERETVRTLTKNAQEELPHIDVTTVLTERRQMSAALELTAVQSNLRQLGHDVSEEAIVHMLKDLDLSRLLGQLAMSHRAAATARSESSSRETAAQAAPEEFAEPSQNPTVERSADARTLRDHSAYSASRISGRSSKSTSDRASPVMPSSHHQRSQLSSDSASQLSSHAEISMFSSDAVPSQEPLPSGDEMSQDTSIFPDEDEEDTSGYYVSARTADLVGALSHVTYMSCLQTWTGVSDDVKLVLL